MIGVGVVAVSVAEIFASNQAVAETVEIEDIGH